LGGGASFNQVVYNGTKFVASDIYSSAIAYSTDGITWSTKAVGTTGVSGTGSSLGFGHVNAAYVEVLTPQIAYTVPAGKTATITTMIARNNDSVARTYDLSVVPASESNSLKHAIRYDAPVAAGDFDLINLKITMGAGDSLYIFPSSPLYFGLTVFGVEIS
jgi:hypothetical protein